jgi:hypothetical protein
VWDARSDAACANTGGRLALWLPAANLARGEPFDSLEPANLAPQ